MGHGVDVATGLEVDHVGQQAHFHGAVHARHTDGGVLGCGGGGGVVVGAICAGEDGVVGVDQGLDLGRCVHRQAGDVGRSQGVVDGVEVAGHEPRHTGVGIVHSNGGNRCGTRTGQTCAVGLRESADDADRVVDRVDQGLQVRLAVHTGAVVVGGDDGRLHSGDVVGGDTGDAQRLQLGHRHVGRTCGVGHDSGHSIGQALNFGHGVHVGGVYAADDVAQQIGPNTWSDAGHADGGVLRCSRVCTGVCGAAIGFGQDGGVSIDDALHVNAGVGGFAVDHGTGQSVTDGGQVVVVHAGHCRSGEVVQ